MRVDWLIVGAGYSACVLAKRIATQLGHKPYYPIPREENRERYDFYLKECQKLNDPVIFAGRLVEYK